MAGPVALVTGGTRGIGLGVARALAARGWDLAICGLRPPAAVADVIADLERGGRRVLYVSADVADAAARTRLLSRAIDALGGVDVLVNNAGRAPRVRADLLEASRDSFDEIIDVNLRGPYLLTQQVARHLLERQRAADGAGRSLRQAVVFVTSISAVTVSLNRGEYCVSKAGLSMAAKLYAARLAPHGIPVFEVRPGIIETDMTAAAREAYDRRIAGGLVPARRWGTPADVGDAVAALVSGELGFATGSIIDVSGGLHIPTL
ncbi:MAG: 3-ketoacyl-ACP reductase [Acidobacteria bacterium]|nr:3-ketoacyl-ACP reductase [Acidobacteriota bacterium]